MDDKSNRLRNTRRNIDTPNPSIFTVTRKIRRENGPSRGVIRRDVDRHACDGRRPALALFDIGADLRSQTRPLCSGLEREGAMTTADQPQTPPLARRVAAEG